MPPADTQVELTIALAAPVSVSPSSAILWKSSHAILQLVGPWQEKKRRPSAPSPSAAFA
jgi:hypothetical protein